MAVAFALFATPVYLASKYLDLPLIDLNDEVIGILMVFAVIGGVWAISELGERYALFKRVGRLLFWAFHEKKR